MTDQTEPLNPVQIETSIREVSDRISKSVRVCSDRYAEYLKADREYDQQFAAAYLDAEGPAHEKKYEAELQTLKTRETRDVADVAYRYADRLARALQDELRAWQSVGASVRSTYAVAGRGE